MAEVKTIKVETWGGKEKDITLEDFIKRWIENAELWNLADYRDLDNTNKIYKSIEKQIADLATHKFNLTYNYENKKEAA